MRKPTDAKLAQELERKKKLAEIEKKANACRRFINDKRYAVLKEIIENEIKALTERHDNLIDLVHNNDDYLRYSLSAMAEIRRLKWFLGMPKYYIDLDNKIKENAK